MRKCILPTDYSRSANQAIEYALRLLGQLPEPVNAIVVHAYTAPATVPVYDYDDSGVEAPGLEQEQQKLDDYVRDWRKRFPGIHLESSLLVGSFLSVLTSLIEAEPDIELVILGTKGATGAEEVLLGSNAARAARSLPRPVFIIPEDASFQAPERIVLATDFYLLDDLRVLDPLRGFAQHFKPHLLSLMVVPPGKATDPTPGKQRLQAYFGSARYAHFQEEGDDTVATIATFAEQHRADWLALVGRERGFFASLFHRSVVKKMAFHAPVPLLILK